MKKRELTYRVHINDENDATLVVTHVCDHEGSYWYAGAEFAHAGAAKMAEMKCTSCMCRDSAEAHKIKTEGVPA